MNVSEGIQMAYELKRKSMSQTMHYLFFSVAASDPSSPGAFLLFFPAIDVTKSKGNTFDILSVPSLMLTLLTSMFSSFHQQQQSVEITTIHWTNDNWHFQRGTEKSPKFTNQNSDQNSQNFTSAMWFYGKGLTFARVIFLGPKLFLCIIWLMQVRSLESTTTQKYLYKPRLEPTNKRKVRKQ